MSDQNAQHLRQLSIKTGVVKRLFREGRSYRQEATSNAAQLEKLRAAGADGADIRNAERVLKDSEQMIPRTQESLEQAMVQLEDLVDALKSEGAISESEQYQTAEALLQEVKAAPAANGSY